jgi:hypothetical protein
MTSALELRQVSKVYGSGPSEVRALQADYLASSAASSWRVAGAERFRQEHAPDDRRQPRSRNQRPGARGRGRPGKRLALDRVEDATPLDRLCRPGLQPAPGADGCRERHPAGRARRRLVEGRARPALEAIEELDVVEHADRYPDELPGGERGLPLADEPTARSTP